MKKILLSVLLLVGLLIGNVNVSAQTADIDPLAGSLQTCTTLTQDLRLGSNGSQVSSLQFFLQAKKYLNSEPTGYFGLLTQSAVMNYQNTNGILPATGFVGSITRAKINAAGCSGGTTTTTTTVSVSGCANGSVYSSTTGEKCSTATTQSKPKPYINNVQGKAAGDFEIDSQGTGTQITGKNLIYGGKDARVFVNGKEASVTQYGTKLLFFTAPSLTKGKSYELYVKTDAGKSNVVKVKVISEAQTTDSGCTGREVYSSTTGERCSTSSEQNHTPTIEMVAAKASDDFEIFPGESAGIAGKNLIYAGKDTQVFIGGTEAHVTQYNSNNIQFETPSLSPGTYDFYVRTSYGTSEAVQVKMGDRY